MPLASLRSDLEATTQANCGQRALHLADAGAQAAAAQPRTGADPAHYDADGADNTGWAQVPPDGSSPGETLTLDGGAASGTIRYLIPARTAVQQRDGRYAPEQVPAGLPDYPDKDFVLAVSEGSSGETRRKSRSSSTRMRPAMPTRSSSGAGGRPTSRPWPPTLRAPNRKPQPPNFLTGP